MEVLKCQHRFQRLQRRHFISEDHARLFHQKFDSQELYNDIKKGTHVHQLYLLMSDEFRFVFEIQLLSTHPEKSLVAIYENDRNQFPFYRDANNARHKNLNLISISFHSDIVILY